MSPKLVALVPVCALALTSVGCAASSIEDDESVDTNASALAKRDTSSRDSTKDSSSGSGLTLSGKVTSSCVGAGSATVRLAVELTSSSSDGVVVTVDGAFTDSVTIQSSAWSKMKDRSHWAFVASTATLENGSHTVSVCATQSSKQTCASYSFAVSC